MGSRHSKVFAYPFEVTRAVGESRLHVTIGRMLKIDFIYSHVNNLPHLELQYGHPAAIN